MRTKQTGKRSSVPGAAKANGAPKTPQAAPDMAVKSPSQPQKLSEKDEARLRDYLNKNEKPFSVATVPMTKKRKRASAPLPVQEDLFEPRLNVAYEVKPSNNWESLRRYKKFTVGSESMAVGECILVKHDDSPDPRIDLAAQWKAKVLEVRALDTEHVYLRVAWLNRPEDLDSGRKAYHGKNELIPTNQMDIIDAMAVNGRLEVQHWDDADDESTMMTEETFFWRQTYDFANTKTFSKLRQICIDAAPQNPDEMILQCSNAECRKWLHVKCIAEDAVRRAAEAASGKRKSTGSAKKKPTLKDAAISANSSAQAKAALDAFTAEVFIKSATDGSVDTPAEKTEIVVTDGTSESQHQAVKCLFCRSEID